MLKDEKVFKELIKRTSAPETSSETYLYNYDGGRYCELLSILREMDDGAEA